MSLSTTSCTPHCTTQVAVGPQHLGVSTEGRAALQRAAAVRVPGLRRGQGAAGAGARRGPPGGRVGGPGNTLHQYCAGALEAEHLSGGAGGGKPHPGVQVKVQVSSPLYCCVQRERAAGRGHGRPLQRLGGEDRPHRPPALLPGVATQADCVTGN